MNLEEMLVAGVSVIRTRGRGDYLYIGSGVFQGTYEGNWLSIDSFREDLTVNNPEFDIIAIVNVAGKLSLHTKLRYITEETNVCKLIWERSVKKPEFKQIFLAKFHTFSQLIERVEDKTQTPVYSFDLDKDERKITCANAWDYYNCGKPFHTYEEV